MAILEQNVRVPKVKIFINQGCVESVYSDSALVDVEIVNCERASCLPSFDEQYEKTQAAGFTEITYESTACDSPYRSDEE